MPKRLGDSNLRAVFGEVFDDLARPTDEPDPEIDAFLRQQAKGGKKTKAVARPAEARDTEPIQIAKAKAFSPAQIQRQSSPAPRNPAGEPRRQANTYLPARVIAVLKDVYEQYQVSFSELVREALEDPRPATEEEYAEVRRGRRVTPGSESRLLRLSQSELMTIDDLARRSKSLPRNRMVVVLLDRVLEKYPTG